jgi:hypothetical protein
MELNPLSLTGISSGGSVFSYRHITLTEFVSGKDAVTNEVDDISTQHVKENDGDTLLQDKLKSGNVSMVPSRFFLKIITVK